MWKNVGQDRERHARVVAAARFWEREDTVARPGSGGGDEQGIGQRIRLTEGMEKDHEKHEARMAIIEEKGSCFQL